MYVCAHACVCIKDVVTSQKIVMDMLCRKYDDPGVRKDEECSLGSNVSG